MAEDGLRSYAAYRQDAQRRIYDALNPGQESARPEGDQAHERDQQTALEAGKNARILTHPTHDPGLRPAQESGEEAVRAKEEQERLRAQQARPQRESHGPALGGTQFQSTPPHQREQESERDERQAHAGQEATDQTRERSARDIAKERLAAFTVTTATLSEKDREQTLGRGDRGGQGY